LKFYFGEVIIKALNLIRFIKISSQIFHKQTNTKMASNFPKLPGYVPTHDPTVVNHKKISHVKLEKLRNAKNVVVPLHALPR